MRTGPTGTIVVKLNLATGVTLSLQAEVRLFSHMGFQQTSSRLMTKPEVVFSSVPVGEYNVEVTAPGFAPAREQAVLWKPGMIARVFLTLQPESAGRALRGPLGFPVLAPKAAKRVEKGIEALRAKNFPEARRQLEHALKMAPGHPFVNYLVGLLFFQLKDLPEAQAYFEKVASLAPNFTAGHEALGTVLSSLRDYRAAIAALERALVLEPNRWELHWKVALACFDGKLLEKSRAHAERARELSKGQAPQIQVLLGLALAGLGQRDAAIRELEDFLRSHSDHAAAPTASQALERIRASTLHQGGGLFAAGVSGLKERGVDDGTIAGAEVTGRSWAPPEVDKAVPPVTPGISCSLADVLRSAGQNVVQMAQNLESISASEQVEFAELDSAGNERSSESATFTYVASIRESRPGMLSVEEMRESSKALDRTAARMFSKGLAALAFIFHPYYVDDFQMQCEGLGQSKGEPAWQVQFRQRNDRASRILSYRSEKGVFPLSQKGRAWIGANSYQILRVETDLVKPIREIGLEREHIAIEYGPVEFRDRQLQLWLPASAVLHAELRGRRYYHRHSFKDFLLFSVDTRQNIRPPQ
jgi:tetratricopeptide (TPR) repeat protein